LLVERCRRNGIVTQLPTNATLLTRDLAADLLDAGVDQFVIGMEGASAPTYEAIRRGAAYEAVVDNVRVLAELKQRKRSRASIVIQMVVLPENRHEVDLLRRQWRIPGVDGVRLKRDERCASAGVSQSPAISGRSRPHCLFAWQGPLWINADGNLMRHGFGHSDEISSRAKYDEVLCEGFPSRDWHGIFNGPEMIALRENLVKGQFDLCGPCATCQAYGPPPWWGWMTFLPNHAQLKLALRYFDGPAKWLF
jgi:hypothetical protein